MIGVGHLIKSEFKQALQFLSEGLTLTKRAKDLEGEALALLNIGSVHYRQYQLAQAKEYYERALELYKLRGDKRGVANCFNNIGNIYIDQANYPLALQYQTKALAVYEEIKFDLGIASANSNIANIYESLGNYPKSLDYHFRTLALREKLNDKLGISVVYNNLGSVYSKLGDIDKAIDYHEKSLAIRRSIGDVYGQSRSLYNLGYNYQGTDTAKSRKYLLESLELAERIGNRKEVGSVYQVLANLQYQQGNIERAISLYLKAWAVAKYLQERLKLSTVAGHLALAYADQGNWKLADSMAQSSLQIAQATSHLANVKVAYQMLYTINKRQGKYEAALRYVELFKQVNDSVTTVEKAKQIANLETIAELDKKEKEIELLQKNQLLLSKDNALQRAARTVIEKQQQVERLKALAQFENDRRKKDSLQRLAREAQVEADQLRIEEARSRVEKNANAEFLAVEQQRARLLLTVLILSLIVVILLTILFVLAQRNNASLRNANYTIAEQKSEIEAMNENLEKLVADRTEALLQRTKQLEDYAFFNAHALRGPIATLLGLFQVLKTEKDPSERRRLLEHVNQTAEKIDHVVHELQSIVADEEVKKR